MKKKIICFSVCMLLLVTYAGAVTTPDVKVKTSDKSSSDFNFTHNILGEFFTIEDVTPSRYSHRALKNLYIGEYHPFYYISMVYDKNKWAEQRSDELDVDKSPTVVWDGGYIKDEGSNVDVEEDMADYNESIIACGNRNVKDIDLNLDVEWLGAVNPIPPDGATDWWGNGISFSISAMEINVSVINNEDSQYHGHLHGYVTEINSTIWVDKWGNPYTFAFLDYAWNDDTSIDSGDTWNDTIEWDGCDHNDGYGHNYSWIEQDNIMVIASVFDEDNNNYSDETTGFVAGIGTDPKLFDFYFGEINPPPLVVENKSSMEWFPHDPLNWSTTYYWKVDVRDAKGNVKYGDIWSFTTRDNNPPYEPSDPIPPNGATNWSGGGLCWTGGDPDGDDVRYDVYFGDHPDNMLQIAWNQTDNCSMIMDLEFNKTYYWKIVTWEVDYDLFTVGPIWSFTTSPNYPPNPAEDPHPPDGDPAVPTEGVILEWNGSDPNFGDTLRYDLYFDDLNPPLVQVLVETINDFWAIPFTLEKNKTYYWRVDTYDKMGEFAEGYVWSFSTGVNHPPDAPKITGPGSVPQESIKPIVKNPANYPPDKPIKFRFEATDPDGHDVYYWIDWGDGSSDGWIGPYPSGEEIIRNHTWHCTGDFRIRARAKDIYEAVGPWGELSIPIERNKVFNFLFLRLLAQFPNAFPILRQLLYI